MFLMDSAKVIRSLLRDPKGLLSLNKEQTKLLGEVLSTVFLEVADFKLLKFIDVRNSGTRRRALIEEHCDWILKTLQDNRNFILEKYPQDTTCFI